MSLIPCDVPVIPAIQIDLWDLKIYEVLVGSNTYFPVARKSRLDRLKVECAMCILWQTDRAGLRAVN